MNTHRVEGAGGIALYVEEAGDRGSPAIVFLHGYSQSRRAFDRQFAGPLAARFRLVRLDLRGHGLSDKPRDAYGEARLWADDIAAVIDALALDRPVLSGWSYGGIVICDYLRAHGPHRIAGIHLVGAVTRLGRTNLPFLGEDFLGFLPGFYSDDSAMAAQTMERFLDACTTDRLSGAVHSTLLADALLVPPHVRRALFARRLDNDDLLSGLGLPTLITHGARDAIVRVDAARHHVGLVATARLSIHRDAGHMPFLEEPARFDSELAEFVAETRIMG